MIDERTIEQVKAKFVRAFGALEAALDDELTDEEAAITGGLIVRHLMNAELGRAPTDSEFDLMLRHVQKSFERDDNGQTKHG